VKESRDGTWAVIAGGGTAGHVLPGIAIGKALVARGHPPQTIHFVGSDHGIESRLVPEAGFELTLLPGRGLQRKLTLANVTAAAGLVVAFVRAVALLGRRRPAVVVALGGYASVACGLAAVIWRVPVVVAEQNAVPGSANRLVARFARASAVSFDGTALPRATVTGNPLRDEILGVDRRRDRERARAQLELPLDRKVVVAFGGSLGALRINTAVQQARALWRPRADVALYHVVGARDWDLVAADSEGDDDRDGVNDRLLYRPVRYEDRMELVLAAADVAVCRAGATSVAELAAVGLPAVLVPLPGAPGDHQTANARALSDAGAAVLVPDQELDGARLVAEVDALLAEPDRLERMAAAAAAAGRRDAGERVAALVEEHARAT
jgi:UDP-N-acetylglucosamine--N-acetylmuramyl-(pentapeptide) pyrophosphoryl-undecaprenol N-acetylglucosamine transferase